MKTIPLSQGKFAMVDDADYDAVSQFKWHAVKYRHLFYAARNILKPNGKKAVQFLHRFLMPGVPEIDHRDGDGLNDSREKNLRPATTQQNRQGFQRKRLDASSKFRGVCWDTRLRKWVAKIKADGNNIYLGLFTVEEDAARAYDAAARKYFGEYASPNFKAA